MRRVNYVGKNNSNIDQFLILYNLIIWNMDRMEDFFNIQNRYRYYLN